MDIVLQVTDWQFFISATTPNKELTKKPLEMKLAKRLFLTSADSTNKCKRLEAHYYR